MPKGAQEVRSKAGGTIPLVLVTTADAEKGLDAISYKVLKADTRKAARSLKKSLANKDVVGSAAGESEASKGPEQTYQEWTNNKNKKISAMALKVEDGKVHFKMKKGGKTVVYPLNKLSKASQEKLAEQFGE